MRLIFEDLADHYLEDPDNEERIKKAEQDADKQGEERPPKQEEPVYVDVAGLHYPDGYSRVDTRYYISGTAQILTPDYMELSENDEVEIQILDDGFNTKENEVLTVLKRITKICPVIK